MKKYILYTFRYDDYAIYDLLGIFDSAEDANIVKKIYIERDKMNDYNTNYNIKEIPYISDKYIDSYIDLIKYSKVTITD